MGNGELTGSQCLREAPSGTRWDVYRLDRQNELRAVDDSEGTMPIGRAAFAHRIREAPHIVGYGIEAAGEDRWLAVARSELFGRPAHSIVAAEPGCKLSKAELREAEVTVLRRDIPPLEHLTAVEEYAYRFGADVLLRCREGVRTVHVPSLYRTQLVVDDTAIGPSLFGESGLELRRGGRRSRTLLVAALSKLAVGETTSADFLAERTLRAATGGVGNAFLVRAMQLAAVSRRPESAFRRGEAGASGAWNRDNNPEYLIGRAAAEVAMGKDRDYFATLKTAREAAVRRDETRLELWLDWAETLVRYEGGDLSGGEIREAALSQREAGRDEWALAYELLTYRKRAPDRVASNREKDGHDPTLHLLRSAARGSEVELACPESEPCPLDVYGRRLNHVLGRTDQQAGEAFFSRLLRMGTAAVQPGVHRVRLPGSWPSARKVSVLGALTHQVQSRSAQAFDARLRAHAVEAVETGEICGDALPKSVGDRVRIELRRTTTPAARTLFADWLFERATETVCAAPGEAARSLVSMAAGGNPMRAFLPRVFVSLVDRAETPQERRMVATQAAGYAERQGAGEDCKRWRLSLAGAHAKVGDHRNAERALEHAVNCGDEAGYGGTESILIGYAAFLRSGNLPRRLEHSTRRTLERLVRQRIPDRCAGLADFEFRLFDYLDEDVADLASRLVVESAKKEGVLTLSSSVEQREDAERSLSRAVELLRSAEFEKGREQLEDAQAVFERLGHRPGVARTRLFEKTFFGGEKGGDERESDTTCRASTGIPTSASELRCLHRRKTPEQLLEVWKVEGLPEDDAEARTIAAVHLLAGRNARLHELIDLRRSAGTSTAHPLASFCHPDGPADPSADP